MKNTLICWDSSVLIDWFKANNPNRIKVIQPVITSMDKGDYNLIVSTLIYVEVLATAMSDKAMKKFDLFMKNRKNKGIIAVDIPIAKKAQEIRNRSPKKISTPDAIHIATAIVSKANFLHTFDKDILSLNGTDVVERLSITECKAPGINLPLFS